ncbi:hypothetical protein CVT24_002940 [Panaeolus cyanescens]|uniref:SWIM-type domain-containing protein n=1 Tax=Panaeolus cyanescens TaxID=181874 RepID=A0A409VPE8_9AGAR|nr:hypothetical protein CVT24_002940 [Panaeolus cyanescens]
MVLLKRNQDGEFVEWRSSDAGPSSQPHTTVHATPTPATQEPPAKRPRLAAPAPAPVVVPAKTNAVPPRTPRGSRSKATPTVNPADHLSQTGPSSMSLPSASQTNSHIQTPTKRGRQKAVAAAAEIPSSQPSESQSQPEEKRQARFKPKPPQNILERLGRVMTQRMFMIDRTRRDGELREEFSVLGSTGNVYTVTIDKLPRCNCPDAAKGNHCKHILFVFFKVLQVRQSSTTWYQKALITSELEEIFRNAPLAPNSIAHPHILAAHARATGKAVPETPTGGTGQTNKRIPSEDDDCPICYDGMHGVPESSLVFCEECGNALHKECFGQWKRTAASTGKSLTCVWCRASWIEPHLPGTAGGGASRDSEGYLNLAGVANVSPVRDTSTYYQGPRRGRRYYGW